jgi:hypothetical protein
MPNSTTGARGTLDGRGWVKVVPNRARAVGSHTMGHCGNDVRHDVQYMCCTCGAHQGQLISGG